jgi:hypothetical protein
VTFAFQVRAPAQGGLYDFQWRMVQDGAEWFGNLSANRPVYAFASDDDTVRGSGSHQGERVTIVVTMDEEA